MHKRLIITILLIIAFIGVGVVAQQMLAPAKDRLDTGLTETTEVPTNLPSISVLPELDSFMWKNFEGEDF